MTLTVDRDGRSISVPVKLTPKVESDSFGNKATVADLGISFAVPIVGAFAEDSPAYAAGMRTGDRVTAVDGNAIGTFRAFLPARISRHIAAASANRNVTSITAAHVTDAIKDEAKRPANHKPTSPARGNPERGRRPVQFGTAVRAKPAMIAAR